MKKRKSLSKRLSDPNSRTWRNKADYAWKLVVHQTGCCAVCGATKADGLQLQAHHLLPRELLMFRHIPNNGVLLCVRHHKYGLEISAHKNPVKFLFWLRDNSPIQYQWLLDVTAVNALVVSSSELNFKESYRRLILMTPPGD